MSQNFIGCDREQVVTDDQIVIAAEIKTTPTDFGFLGPMLDVTRRNQQQIGLDEDPEVVVADSGYWHNEQMDALAAEGVTVLIPPDSSKRTSARPGWSGGRYAWMRRLLAADSVQRLYDRRHKVIEPVFGRIKFNRRVDRFLRRGRTAVLSEWRLATATHNLLKLHQHRIAAAT